VGFVSLLSKLVTYWYINRACVMEQDWDTVLFCPTDYNGPLTLNSAIK